MGTIPTVALPHHPQQKPFTFFGHPEFIEIFLDDLAHMLVVFNPKRLVKIHEVELDEEEGDHEVVIYLDWDDEHADQIQTLLSNLLTRHEEVRLKETLKD